MIGFRSSLIVLPLVVLLSGCQSSRNIGTNESLFAEGGYLCTAVPKAGYMRPVKAWANDRFSASFYAMKRCESHHKMSRPCKIRRCIWTGSMTEVSRARWYTCYISNRISRTAVWIGTSHDRLDAVQWAYSRCVQYSGQPNQCYLSYCRIW